LLHGSFEVADGLVVDQEVVDAAVGLQDVADDVEGRLEDVGERVRRPDPVR
jgi:hypothetical protein